jgi:triosephosphate isomerase (TIM)
MNKKLLVFNWKMNFQTLEQTHELLNHYLEIEKENKQFEIVICPPTVYLSTVFDIISECNSNIKIASQDISQWHVTDQNKGAFTGEVSGEMLKSVGCSFTIVGHSETRSEYTLGFHEIRHKIEASLKENLTPVLCIGYQGKIPKEEQQEYISEEKLKEQLKTELYPWIMTKSSQEIIIAYEPVWAIGSGKTPTNEHITVVAQAVKRIVKEYLGSDVKLRFLYGGSVSDKNLAELLKITEVDGFLVGGAGLSPESLKKMIAIDV